jgi:hypothetical protein
VSTDFSIDRIDGERRANRIWRGPGYCCSLQDTPAKTERCRRAKRSSALWYDWIACVDWGRSAALVLSRDETLGSVRLGCRACSVSGREWLVWTWVVGGHTLTLSHSLSVPPSHTLLQPPPRRPLRPPSACRSLSTPRRSDNNRLHCIVVRPSIIQPPPRAPIACAPTVRSLLPYPLHSWTT